MADVKRLQIRRDTLADWVSVNPILLEGEVGLIIENGGISSLKIGDGASSFVQLPQLTLLEAVFGGYVSRQDLAASLRDYATIQYVDSEIGNILGGASGAYDTLKEIEDILKNDTTGLAALLEEIGTKAEARVVDALASRVSQNESNIADHTNKITANTDNIDSTIRRVAANEADLKQLNITVDTINRDYAKLSDIPTKTSQLIDDIGYALARNIKALAGLDIVTKDYIADAAVTTSKIKDGAITRDKLSSAVQQQLSWIPSTTDDLPEGSSNLYFTNDRAISAVSPRLEKVENGLIATQEEVRGYSAIISELQGTVKLKADQSSVDSLAEAIEAINEGIADLTTDDVYEGANKYFTNARAIAALSDTLKGYVTTLAFRDYAVQIQQNSTNITNLTKTVDKIYEEYVTWDNIPTKTSQLTNDSNFITSVTDALGYTPYNSANFTKANIKSTLGISDWALASSKPTYTAAEVGALPSSTTIPSKGTVTGWGFVTADDVAAELENFLPLDGGKMSGPIEYDDYTSLGAHSNGNFYLGNPTRPLIIRSNGTHTINGNTLIHSGNIGDYALAKDSNGTVSLYGDIEVLSADNSVTIKNGSIISNTGGTDYWSIDDSGNGVFSSLKVGGSNVALASDLSGYLPLGGGQIDGPLTIAYGADLRLKAGPSSTGDSGDLVFYNYSGKEIGRIWHNDGVFCLRYAENDDSKVILHSGNIADYAIAKNSEAVLSRLTVESGGDAKIILNNTDTESKYQYISFRQNGTEYGVLGTFAGDNLVWNQGIILHSRNYSNYALPLSGGTISGDLRLKQYLRINAWEGYGTGSCDAWYNGSTSTLECSAPYLSLNGVPVLTQGALTSINSSLNNKANTADVIPWSATHNYASTVNPNVLTSPVSDRWYLVVKAAGNGNRLMVNVPWVNTTYDLSSYLKKEGGAISGSLTFSATSGSHIIGNSNSEIIFQPSNDTSGANIPLKIAKTGSSTYTMYCDESEVYDLGTSSYKWNILYCRSASQSSDATLKNILGNVQLTTSQIANAPAVHFTWKNGGTKDVGTIAQYWKNVLPEVVSGEEGSYGMNYAVLGVVSSIILARNIETHEQRIARLEKEKTEMKAEAVALKAEIVALKAVIENLKQSA